MILRKLNVKNFRQIAGDYELVFSPPGGRNVTLVLGENGSGKTTLLNAFRWCFYGEVEMENPKELLSHKAVFEAEIDSVIPVEVVLQFEHGGDVYTAKRACRFKKLDGGELQPKGQEQFDVVRIDDSGQTKTLGDPQTFMSRLLPKHLARFFFFQGESILQIALQRSREELREGVETFLDFRVLDRSVDHLQKVERVFERELSKMASGDVKAISDKIDETLELIDRLEEKRKQELRNVDAVKADIEDVRRRLGEIEEFRPFLEESRRQEDAIHALGEQRKDAVRSLKTVISKDGYLAFESDVLSRVESLASEAVASGDLPAKIKPQFVTELIERGECICGSEIDDQLRSTLEEWKGQAGLAELEAAIQVARGAVGELQLRKEELRSSLAERREKVASIDEEAREAKGKKSAADRKIQDIDFDQDFVRQLQRKLEDLQNGLVEHRVAVTELTNEIEEQQKKRDKLEEDRAALLQNKKSERLVSRRIQATRRVGQALQNMRTLWSQVVQEHLDAQLKNTWDEVAQLPRQVAFNRDFSLSIEERGGAGQWVTSAPSEANCQVLALAFVSALIRFAKEVSANDRTKSVFSGGEFPLVMDAPFAKMDVEFKERVPRGLSRVVPQIVVISSIDQWQGVVADSLGGMVSRAYVLTLHKPGKTADARTVRALGVDIDYVRSETGAFESDWTALTEIEL